MAYGSVDVRVCAPAPAAFEATQVCFWSRSLTECCAVVLSRGYREDEWSGDGDEEAYSECGGCCWWGAYDGVGVGVGRGGVLAG